MKKSSQVEIDERLLAEAEALARREAVSLRDLVEEGLCLVIAKRRGRFYLRDTNFRGDRLLPGVDLDNNTTLLGLMNEEYLERLGERYGATATDQG
jgi:hypothetical protein